MCLTDHHIAPGDLIATGTPRGVGAAHHLQVFLKPGQMMTTTIEQIGRLQNTIVQS